MIFDDSLTFNVNSLAKARTHSLFDLYNILHQIKVYEEPVSMKKNQEVMIKWDFLGKMRGHKISALPDGALAAGLFGYYVFNWAIQSKGNSFPTNIF